MVGYDLVKKSYDELVASGDIHDVPFSPSQDNIISSQKAYLTRRAAYYLWLSNPNNGLLSKTTGTNVMGLSIDIVLMKNGDFYDIATDVEVGNGFRAVRTVNAGIQTGVDLIPRWVLPTKELAGLSDVPPIPPEPPDDDINAKLDKIIATQVVITKMIDDCIELINNNTTIIESQMNMHASNIINAANQNTMNIINVESNNTENVISEMNRNTENIIAEINKVKPIDVTHPDYVGKLGVNMTFSPRK